MTVGGARRTALPRALVRMTALTSVLIVAVPLTTGLAMGTAQAAQVLVAPVLESAPVSPATVANPVFAFTSDAPTVCSFGPASEPMPAATACSSPFVGTTGADGTYLFTVQAVAGDDTSAVTSTTYVRDATAAVEITEPGSPSSDPTPAWALGLPTGASATCAVGSATARACSSSFVADPLEEGSHTLVVRVTGVQGSTKVVTSSPYVLDRTAPAAPVVTGMPAMGGDPVGRWVFSAAPGDTAVCELLRQGALVRTITGCTSPVEFALTGQVTWQARVTLTDAAGNTGPAGTSAPYLLDTVAPAAPVFLTGPQTPGVDPTPTWTLSAAGYAATDEFECRVLRSGADVVPWTTGTRAGPAVTCAMPLPAGLDDGPLQVQARALDAVGNASAPSTGPAYVLDSSGPVTVVAGPRGRGNDATPTWTFTPEPSSTATCRLDAVGGATGVPSDCTPGTLTTAELPDGSYRLTVVQTDALGNTGPESVLLYEVDTVAPATPAVTGPTDAGRAASITWAWNQAGSDSARCRLLRAGLAQPEIGCAGGTLNVQLPADGAWQLQVQLTDDAGNAGGWDAAGTSAVYLLDTVAPAAPAVALLTPTGPGPEATWDVAPAADAVVSTCQVLAGTSPLDVAVSCSGTFRTDLSGRADGRYTLVAVSADAAGNTAQSTSAFVLDTAAPAAPVVTGPSGPGRLAGSTWNIVAEPDADLSCRLVLFGTPQAWAPCISPFVTTLPQEGSWVLEVRQTDAAGLTGPVGSSQTYYLDTTAPEAPSVTGPTGPSADLSPAFALNGPGGALSCAVRRDGSLLRGFTACSSPYPLDLLSSDADGRYVVLARVTDLAGNVSAEGASAPYVLDRVAPRTPVVQGPTGPSSAASVAWTWTPEPGATSGCVLTLDGAPVAAAFPCAPGDPVDLTVGDGAYALTVTVTDEAGNRGSGGTSDPYVLDTTAPSAPQIAVAPTVGPSRAPLFTAVRSADTVSTTCRLLRPDGAEPEFRPCALPRAVDLTDGPQGSYVLEVRSLDAAGNTSGTGAATYLLDDVPPAVPVLTVPGAAGAPEAPVGADPTPTAVFLVEAGSVATCRVLGLPGALMCSAPGASDSSFTPDLSARPDGVYVLEVVLEDAAGNRTTSTLPYRLDRQPPALALSQAPGSISSAATWTWTWTTELGASTRCALVGPAGTTPLNGDCTSGVSVDMTGLGEGDWLLRITATDAAGNASTTDSAHVLDRRVPSLVVTAPAVNSGAGPTWTISTDGNPATIRCLLVRPGGTSTPVACGTSYTLPAEAVPVQGRYVLQVSVLSLALVSAAAESSYLLDTLAPALTVDVGRTPTQDGTPSWITTTSPDANALVSCQILGPLALTGAVPVGSPTRACGWSGTLVTAPDGAPLDLGSDGRYLLLLQVADAAGNTSALPTQALPTAAWVRDTVAAPLTVTVPALGKDPAPRWVFTGLETGAMVSCTLSRVDGGSSQAVACDPHGYQGALAADGTYRLTVSQTDSAGNTSRPASADHLLDRVRPLLSAVDGPAQNPGNLDRVTFAWSSEADARYTCTLTSTNGLARAVPCDASYDLDATGLPDGTYTLTVVATDPAGNASEAGSRSYTLDRVAPAAPTFLRTPPGLGPDPVPVWAIGVRETGLSTFCRLERIDTAATATNAIPATSFEPCTTQFSVDLLDGTDRGEGDYRVHAYSQDEAGNDSTVVTSRIYRFDLLSANNFGWIRWAGSHPASDPELLPPVAQDGFTNSASATWEFITPAEAAVTCVLKRLVRDGEPEVMAQSCRPTGRTWTLTKVLPSEGDYRLDITVTTPGDEPQLQQTSVTYDRTIDPPTFINQSARGGDSRFEWSWSAPPNEIGAVAVCQLSINNAPFGAAAPCEGTSFVEDLDRPGIWTLTVTYYDRAGNSSSATATYTWHVDALPRPVVSLTPGVRGTVGTVTELLWQFRPPAGVKADCTLFKDDRVVPGAFRVCTAGSYRLPLAGQTPGVLSLGVSYTQPNRRGSYVDVRFALLPRVQAPTPTPTRPQPQPRPQASRSETPGPAPRQPQGPSAGAPTAQPAPTPVPVADELSRREPDTGVAAAPQGPSTRSPGTGGPSLDGLPNRLGDALGPVFRNVVTKPALPLALLSVVLAFLLVQNRIDRRDPKLAAAPVEGEPELGFGPTYRPGGAPA